MSNRHSPDRASVPGRACCGETWDEAYLRFQSPAEEVRKFTRRLLRLGAQAWPREARIVELFCGRGNGLAALHRLGFTRLEGVDLSADLLAHSECPADCLVGDCRDLPLEDSSRDILIVQGGLHHLEELPDDLERTLSEMRRVLEGNGRVVIIEPWRTPFLSAVHAACRSSVLRRLWRKLDALAVMIEHERDTYEEWLSRGPEILEVLGRYFDTERLTTSWGKLTFVGRPRPRPPV